MQFFISIEKNGEMEKKLKNGLLLLAEKKNWICTSNKPGFESALIKTIYFYKAKVMILSTLILTETKEKQKKTTATDFLILKWIGKLNFQNRPDKILSKVAAGISSICSMRQQIPLEERLMLF